MTKKNILWLVIPVGVLALIFITLFWFVGPIPLIYADTANYLNAGGSYYDLPAHFYFCTYDCQRDEAVVEASKYEYPDGYMVQSTRYWSPNEITITDDYTSADWQALQKRISDLPRAEYEQDSFMLHGDDCLPASFIILGYSDDAFPTNNATYIGNTISSIASNSLVRAIILPNSSEHFDLEIVVRDTTSPVLDGFTGVYITNVDDPISVATLKASISAIDDVDGDITNKISISTDNYTANMHKLGLWPVVFTVSDNAGNSATITIQVSVVDKTAPVITLAHNTYTSNLSAPLKLSDILGDITATDNYDGDLSSKIVIYYDGYSSTSTTTGSHTVTFKVSDNSGNSSLKDITINVVDDIRPTISGNSSYTKSANSSLSSADIKAGLIANDNYDNDLTSFITEVSNTYIGKENKVGTYYITYKVTDTAGNSSDNFVVAIQVVDTQKPTFYISNVILNIADYNKLSHEDIISYLCQTKAIDESLDYTYNFSQDTYTENEGVPGSYTMVAEVDYVDGKHSTIKLAINILSKDYYIDGKNIEIDSPIAPVVNNGFFARAWLWISNAFSSVSTFFSGIWSWLMTNIFDPIFK